MSDGVRHEDLDGRDGPSRATQYDIGATRADVCADMRFDNDLVPAVNPLDVVSRVARGTRVADDERLARADCRLELDGEVVLEADVERRFPVRGDAAVVRRVRRVVATDAAKLQCERPSAFGTDGDGASARRKVRKVGHPARCAVDDHPTEGRVGFGESVHI
jgi:hypothetical protein